MIISTCIDKGHEHTTAEFINTCPTCGSNMQVQEIIEPRALSIETRLIVAREKQKQIIDAAFARYMGLQEAIFDAQDNNAPAAREQQLRAEYEKAEDVYDKEANKLSEIVAALSCLKVLEEIANDARGMHASFMDVEEGLQLFTDIHNEAAA